MRLAMLICVLLASACDSSTTGGPSEDEGGCFDLTCAADEICALSIAEVCDPGCDPSGDVDCACRDVPTPFCACPASAVRASDGRCEEIPRGFSPFEVAVADATRSVLSLTDSAALSACTLADDPKSQPSGAASQIILATQGGCTGEVTALSTQCFLPDTHSTLGNCAWFRRWNASGRLVQRDFATSGAVRCTLDTGTWTSTYDIELNFADGTTYVDTVIVDFDQHEFDPVCTEL